MKVKVLLSLLFGAFFVWLAVKGVDFDVMGQALTTVDYLPLIPFMVLVIAYHLIRVYRWQLILRPTHPLPFRTLFSINSVGFMAINVLPARLGELTRPFLLLEREDVPLGAGLASIVVERMLDFLCMLLILVLVIFLVDLPTTVIMVRGEEYDIMGVVRNVFLVAALPMVGGLVGLILFEEWMYKLLHVTAGRWVPRLANRFEVFCRSFMASLAPLKNPKMLGIQVLLTLIIWSITPVTEWLMFKMFHLDQLGFDAALTVVAAILIVMLVPGPPGFVGNFEAGAMGGLAAFGISGGVALGYALMLHWSQILQVVVFGMFFLFKDQISFRSIVKFSKEVKADVQAGG